MSYSALFKYSITCFADFSTVSLSKASDNLPEEQPPSKTVAKSDINNTDTKNEEIEKVKEDIQKKDNESKVMMYVSDENKKQESNFNKKA